MSERKFEQDKVYLKNKNTGEIHEYEKLLEKHPDFAPVVPNPSKVEKQVPKAK